MDKRETVKKSKHLSYILRHKPEEAGIVLDSAGWTFVEFLLEKIKMSKEDLDFIVENNNKKRFEYSRDGKMIRASQSHSVEVELEYKKQHPPQFLFHGTAERNDTSIKQNGIKKMGRHHVHLSQDYSTALEVGRRHGKPIVYCVEAHAMHKDGNKFYLSTNGVWLTDHVSYDYAFEYTE